MIGTLRLPQFTLSAGTLRDPLALGVLASLLLHGLLLALKFAPPAPVKFAPADSRFLIPFSIDFVARLACTAVHLATKVAPEDAASLTKLKGCSIFPMGAGLVCENFSCSVVGPN